MIGPAGMQPVPQLALSIGIVLLTRLSKPQDPLSGYRIVWERWDPPDLMAFYNKMTWFLNERRAVSPTVSLYPRKDIMV